MRSLEGRPQGDLNRTTLEHMEEHTLKQVNQTQKYDETCILYRREQSPGNSIR